MFSVSRYLLCNSRILRAEQKRPGAFYISEMVGILKSTGITGDKKYGQANQAFDRWSTGSEGVAIGKQACDGNVVRLDGSEVLLSSFLTERPLVPNFASYSCPHYRKRIDELQGLMEKWSSFGVEFLTVYTAEAHAEDGWKLVGEYVNNDEKTAESDFCFAHAKNISICLSCWMLRPSANSCRLNYCLN